MGPARKDRGPPVCEIGTCGHFDGEKVLQSLFEVKGTSTGKSLGETHENLSKDAKKKAPLSQRQPAELAQKAILRSKRERTTRQGLVRYRGETKGRSQKNCH